MIFRSPAGFGALACIFFALPGCHQGSTVTSSKPPSSPTPTIQFTDVTTDAGLRFTHFTGAEGRFLIPESLGSGGAFIDFDNDGWLDLYLVNGTNWPKRPAAGKTGVLYRNQRDGTFRDVTREAGLAVPMYGQGCAVGDYDQDGRDDLLVTCLGPNHLFRNLGGGKFADVTATAGITDTAPWSWHTSAAWVDYDRDGKLDLFVCRYLRWSPETDVACKSTTGARTYCGPLQYPGLSSFLYRNLGNGKFQDVSVPTGIASTPGKSLGVVPVDEDEDGWVDLFVSNDGVANHLWRNEAGKRFREVGQEVGIALADSGAARAGMGVDVADLNNAGDLSFAIGNFAKEGLALFRRGPAGYTDEARTVGLVPATLTRLTFGVAFLDADRDGWTDLFTYNGHVDPRIGEGGEAIQFREPPQLFRNTNGTFSEVSALAGPAFQVPQVGRGCARGDFDNDGRPDLLLCENAGPVRLLRNTSPDSHHWLGLRLRGTRSNRNGYGAEVRLTAGGMTQRRWVLSGCSYLSASDPRALFGLGKTATVDRVEVRWPSGQKSEVSVSGVDRYVDVVEPSDEPISR